jgi:Ribbon-helix-helix protein, copG family
MRDTLTVRLTEDLAEALQEEARSSGLPKGEIVRQAIAARLRQTAFRSVMARHFGTVRGPSDLSTNKSYRRAWTKKRP